MSIAKDVTGSREPKINVRWAVCRMTSWFVALVFGYSGLIHLQNPYRFYDAILRYDIIFGRFALLMAMSLPIVHVMIAYGLFFRSQSRLEPMLGSLLMMMYLLAVTSGWFRGLSIGCGCFGNHGGPIGLLTIAQNMFLMSCCIFLYLGLPKRHEGLNFGRV